MSQSVPYHKKTHVTEQVACLLGRYGSGDGISQEQVRSPGGSGGTQGQVFHTLDGPLCDGGHFVTPPNRLLCYMGRFVTPTSMGPFVTWVIL